jgi:AraC-like DNA-binding protein
MDLRPGYREYAPPSGLRGAVACVWVRVADGTPATILPDACSDLIWQAGRGAFVAGPDTGPAPVSAPRGTVFVGVRLGPGAGGAALRIPLSELRDRRVDAAELDLRLDLPGDLEPQEAARGLLAAAAAEPDPAIVEAARRLRDPRVRVEELAAGLGLSERQLRRRCHAAAGYGAKTLQRVLRFRVFLSAAAAGADLARAALDAGYADQPHLTRECVRLAGTTPAALSRG